MSITNFPQGISSFGAPVVGSLPVTFGKYIFVDADNGNDGNDGTSMDKPVKTIAHAYNDLATSNAGDVIVLSTNAVHTLASMITISKNRVSFVGLGTSRKYGQRARIYMGVTANTTDVFMIKNLAVGTSFTNIKFWNANTVTQNVACFGEGGEYAAFHNCEFYDSTKLTSDTHAEIVLNGDSAQFYNCTIGSLADAVTGDKVRPGVLMTAATVGSGLVSRDVLFDGCRFWKKAGGTTTSFIKIAATADLERGMEIKDCTFVASVLGSVPATAITSATLTNGYVMLSGSTCAFNCTATGTATGIFSGLSAKVAAAIIGIQSTN